MDDSALLALWDGCAGLPARTRAHRLAALGADGDVRAAPLGHWQAGLAAAWRRLAGGPLEAVVDCPGCAGELEVALPEESLPVAGPPTPTTTVAWADREWEVRLPTAADVDAAAGSPDHLLASCTGSAASGQLPIDVVADAVRRADPAALLVLALSCPGCGRDVEEAVDLAAFVWAALEQRARGALRQVATLAAAYGWSEAEILALDPARRRAYEGLVPV